MVQRDAQIDRLVDDHAVDDHPPAAILTGHGIGIGRHDPAAIDRGCRGDAAATALALEARPFEIDDEAAGIGDRIGAGASSRPRPAIDRARHRGRVGLVAQPAQAIIEGEARPRSGGW
jgi:hypothetical protein